MTRKWKCTAGKGLQYNLTYNIENKNLLHFESF